MFSQIPLLRNSDFFFKAYADYKKREKSIEYFSQIKLQCLDQVNLILRGEIPGKRKKWIEKICGIWVINDKIFMLFDDPELIKFRKQMIKCIPYEIRPA